MGSSSGNLLLHQAHPGPNLMAEVTASCLSQQTALSSSSLQPSEEDPRPHMPWSLGVSRFLQGRPHLVFTKYPSTQQPQTAQLASTHGECQALSLCAAWEAAEVGLKPSIGPLCR